MSQELSLIKERLGKILPSWNITDEMEAVCKVSFSIVSENQMHQIYSLGLMISGFYFNSGTMVVSFSERRNS